MESKDKPIERHARFSEVPGWWFLAFAIFVWTGVVALSLYWYTSNLQNDVLKLAESEARANWNKDQAFRRWATSHGGVYVTPTERNPPSPYLAHLEERDLVTTKGKNLTLLTPAEMMRQITEEYEQIYGVKGKITGKVVVNPVNKPDEWQLKALDLFESDFVDELMEVSSISGKPFLRYMKPMYMTEGCDKCHGVLGFKTGDLRGGVSVSIPLDPYIQATDETIHPMRITHAGVWFLGVASALAFALFSRARQRERVSLMKRLEYGAMYDSLTELPNRTLFSDRLHQAIGRHGRESNYLYAVLFVDLDRFKNLNDSFGHATGDELLKEVSARFREQIRPNDTVARMGGDEFTLLLDGVGGLREALVTSKRLLRSLKKPFEINGQQLSIDASIGICVGDSRYTQPDEIVRDADTAMYRAKSLGKGRVDVFDPEMHAEVKRLTRLEHDMRGALDNDEFALHYQPIVNAKTASIVGFETLLRWRHPELGMIPPDNFIPIAEDTGQILRIGDWVVEEACKQVNEWNQRFTDSDPLFVSVNVSTRQLMQKHYPEHLMGILEKIGFAASLLHCEVTETQLLTQQELAGKNLSQVYQRGVHLAAGDFGKGYSSLTYLQNFNFDTIKIDKEFVQDDNPEGRGRKLVRTLLILANDVGLAAVAEGVETEEQYDRLKVMDCELMQGYYLHPPASAATIESLLESGSRYDLHKLIEMNPLTATSACA